MVKQDVEIIEGSVQSWAPPEGTRPGKLLVLHQGATVELTIWADRETGALPEYMAGLNVNALVGSQIQALAVYRDEYKGVRCYRPSQIRPVEGPKGQPQARPQPQIQEPGPDFYVPSPRDVWSAEGQARGNSRSVAATIIAADISTNDGALPSEGWLRAAAAAVNTFSHHVLQGLTLPRDDEEDHEEDQEEDESLAVISADEDEDIRQLERIASAY